MSEQSAQLSEQVVLAGIDEAGYGPLLGPLVVSAVALRLPKGVARQDLWDVFGSTVARRRSSRKTEGRLVIDDSKKVYRSGKGIDVLERTALGALQAAGHAPRSLDELLAVLSPQGRSERFAPYPWYQDRDVALPRWGEAEALRLGGEAFRRDLAIRGGRLLAIRCEILLAGEFNDRVGRTHNKAQVLFELNTRLMAGLRALAGRLPLTLVADKHGGRDHYRPGLMRAFPEAEMTVLGESSRRSQYRLETPNSRCHICFEQSGDVRHLPVALASMMSKYVRELLMERLNAYWRSKLAGLVPTAGYYRDAQRFLRQIAAIQTHPDHLLRRAR